MKGRFEFSMAESMDSQVVIPKKSLGEKNIVTFSISIGTFDDIFQYKNSY